MSCLPLPRRSVQSCTVLCIDRWLIRWIRTAQPHTVGRCLLLTS
jgi:hypothetical protein